MTCHAHGLPKVPPRNDSLLSACICTSPDRPEILLSEKMLPATKPASPPGQVRTGEASNTNPTSSPHCSCVTVICENRGRTRGQKGAAPHPRHRSLQASRQRHYRVDRCCDLTGFLPAIEGASGQAGLVRAERRCDTCNWRPLLHNCPKRPHTLPASHASLRPIEGLSAWSTSRPVA